MVSSEPPPSLNNRGWWSIWTGLPGLIKAVTGLILALGTVGVLHVTQANPHPISVLSSASASSQISGPNPETSTTSSTPEPSPDAIQSPLADVGFTLLVGTRPQLGQLTENGELLIDGRSVATWSLDSADSRRLISLSATPGKHDYQLRGTYTFLTPAGTTDAGEVQGSGTMMVTDGLHLGINYLSDGTFEVVPL